MITMLRYVIVLITRNAIKWRLFACVLVINLVMFVDCLCILYKYISDSLHNTLNVYRAYTNKYMMFA